MLVQDRMTDKHSLSFCTYNHKIQFLRAPRKCREYFNRNHSQRTSTVESVHTCHTWNLNSNFKLLFPNLRMKADMCTR